MLTNRSVRFGLCGATLLVVQVCKKCRVTRQLERVLVNNVWRLQGYLNNDYDATLLAPTKTTQSKNFPSESKRLKNCRTLWLSSLFIA
jgi:hypothetical protein